MFDKDFFPTPTEVIELMTAGLNLENKTVLEPSAGSGNIVDFLTAHGAQVIACEKHPELKKIVQSKCKVIAEDFLTVTSEMISHIDFIIMNPPFSSGDKHVLHAFNIAPPGCKIISLINSSNLKNTYTNSRQELAAIIENYGRADELNSAFNEAERQSNVHTSIVILDKPGENYQNEFQGFFMEDDPQEDQENGIMSYNFIRDLVNRYVAAVKLYDQQLDTGTKMDALLANFYGDSLTFTCTEKGAPKLRNDFKKDLQKAGWKFIFSKMNMQKYVTRGVKDEINKFVEQQTALPFTMRNIYKMIEIIIGTAGQTMDRAIVEGFDKITKHHDENRYNVPGWKTNSHFLVTETFILPWMCEGESYGTKYEYVNVRYSASDETEDIIKALCFLTGMNYDDTTPLRTFFDSDKKRNWGTWYSWGFFEVKGFKKGTMHFKFTNPELWMKFNQRVAKIKGYPLFEHKEQTTYQERQTGRAQQEKANSRQTSSTLF